jgi:lipopolysaccharide/colanic/teichoic acid biosynthesis glycosyltransferase
VTKNRAATIYKFRSMVTDAKSTHYDLNGRFMRDGYLDIPIDCEVYTPFGRILERTELVELPQIFNVLFSGMSWVGNRALPEENVRRLHVLPGWAERFDSPAGLTGISQVVGKYSLTPMERISIESLYSKVYRQGNVLKADLFIALATARLILSGKNMSYDDAVALLESCLDTRGQVRHSSWRHPFCNEFSDGGAGDFVSFLIGVPVQQGGGQRR